MQLILTLLLACNREDSPADLGPCRLSDGGPAALTLDGLALDLTWDRAVEVLAPVIQVGGGFEPDIVAELDRGRLQTRGGLAVINTDLEDDQRGAASRAHLARVMRWAAGEEPDDEGCTLPERVPAADPALLQLLGRSNGGNLAVHTLADATLDLPLLAGLVTWETPSQGRFALTELAEPELDACSWTDGTLLCPMDYSQLVGEDEPPFIDRDGDRSFTMGVDYDLHGLALESGRVHSPELTALLADHPQRATLEASQAFWSEREAIGAASAAIANFPELPVMVTGTSEDHVLELEGSPHVVGLGRAFADAGAAWVRLNPDSFYTGQDDENLAGEGLDPEDPGYLVSPMDPDGLIAAAALEMRQRALDGDWSEDLPD